MNFAYVSSSLSKHQLLRESRKEVIEVSFPTQESSLSIQANNLSVIFHIAKPKRLVRSLKNQACKDNILLEMVKIR